MGWIWGGLHRIKGGLMEFIVIFCRINVNDQGPEKWTDLYAILAGEGRHVSEVEGDGHCLLQALEEAFWRDMIFHILFQKSYKMLPMSWLQTQNTPGTTPTNLIRMKSLNSSARI